MNTLKRNPKFLWSGLVGLAIVALVLALGVHADRVVAQSQSNPPISGFDTDQDGLPDAWEMSQFGHLSYTGEDNYENDGLLNITEYALGTDPKVNNPQVAASTLGLVVYTLLE